MKLLPYYIFTLIKSNVSGNLINSLILFKKIALALICCLTINSSSSIIAMAQQTDLKEGDTIIIAVSTGASNIGAIACMLHNGGIY